MNKLKIYTDGACFPNPGLGAFAFVIVQDEKIIYEEAQYQVDTTNNIMELEAIIKGLKHVLSNKSLYTFDGLIVYSDSQYCVTGINNWIHTWKESAWRNRKGAPVKNKEFWLELDGLRHGKKIAFLWVKGHNGDPFNERADELCQAKVKEIFGQDCFKAPYGQAVKMYEKLKTELN